MKTQKKVLRMRTKKMPLLGPFVLVAVILLNFPGVLFAATAAEIDRDIDLCLDKLYRATPAAKRLAGTAKGILVFPHIVKGGLGIGGQYGEGALRVGGKTTGYYKTFAASYGLQAGAQTFGYAMFFLDDNSLKYLKKSEGWEVGVGPSIVVVDKGKARTMTTTTTRSGVYAFIFSQKGLMAGLGLQGSKITPFTPEK